jgi:hypothetical protein
MPRALLTARRTARKGEVAGTAMAGPQKESCRVRLGWSPPARDRRHSLTGGTAAMLDRLREAAAAHDEPVGSCATVPVGPIVRRSADAGTGIEHGPGWHA